VGEKIYPVEGNYEKSVSAIRTEDDLVVKNLSMASGSSHDAPEEIGPIQRSIITKDEVERARAELQKNLKEEQSLTNIQMQLHAQLDKLKASIATVESQERMAKLALQQAKVIRLLKTLEDPSSNHDPDTITIKLQS
jgi:hypothetical protein